MTKQTYEIILHNRQGASEVFKASTKMAINSWLQTWSDVHNLTARVIDGDGREVGSKAFGRKRLLWGK
jgi:hypothetical protein